MRLHTEWKDTWVSGIAGEVAAANPFCPSRVKFSGK
jgi:hypothetical protein